MNMITSVPWKYEKKGYFLDLQNLSTSNFYPCMLGAGPSMGTVSQGFNAKQFGECEIYSFGGSSSYEWNQNMIKFSFSGLGWSDCPKYALVERYACHAYDEKTIGCIGICSKDYDSAVGATCVWLRGGLRYNVVSNFIPTVFASTYTSGPAPDGGVFSVGPNLYGGTNSNVTVLWTPGDSAVNLASDSMVSAVANTVHPVGSIFESSAYSSASAVGTALGGTWTEITDHTLVAYARLIPATTIVKSKNISSVTGSSAVYTVHFSKAMEDANYTAFVSCEVGGAGTEIIGVYSQTTTSFNFDVSDHTGALKTPAEVSIAVFGRLATPETRRWKRTA